MTATYVPTPTALVDVTEPVDTEPRTVASVTQMTREIADGVMFAQSRTDVLATLAALTAIATPADGLVRHVLGFGLYVFKTSATTGLAPFRLAADDATAGGWVASAAHETVLVRQVPVGLGLRGITNGGAGSTPGTVTVNTTNLAFIPVIGADAQLDFGGMYNLRTYTGATQNYGYLIDINAEMVTGSALSSATLLFTPTSHAGLPTRQPQFAIVRSSVTSVARVNLLSTGNGYVTNAAASNAAYQNVDQSLVFTPDQNATIDKTLYRYYAIVIDEAGTNAVVGNGYHAIQLNFSTIPDARRS